MYIYIYQLYVYKPIFLWIFVSFTEHLQQIKVLLIAVQFAYAATTQGKPVIVGKVEFIWRLFDFFHQDIIDWLERKRSGNL